MSNVALNGNINTNSKPPFKSKRTFDIDRSTRSRARSMLDETDKQDLNATMRRTASESNRTTMISARARLWTVADRGGRGRRACPGW